MVSNEGDGEMSLLRAVGSLGLLLCAGTTLAPGDMTAASVGKADRLDRSVAHRSSVHASLVNTNAVETHAVETRTVQVPGAGASSVEVRSLRTSAVDPRDLPTGSVDVAAVEPSAGDKSSVDANSVSQTLADLKSDDPSPAGHVDNCAVTDACIEDYLWSLYERTPKIDTVPVSEQVKVTVTHKGKTKTVTKTITKLVEEDFTWKDVKAAERVGMSLKDYVIGGMDRNFKVVLYRAMRALDDAGLVPGITSAFRDDYRQLIAAGQKAQSDRSYHGGSSRGGYGHGLAADIVSVRGETRAERWVSSELLWKWIDTNGKDYGVGRPYSDRDAPHVAPIDGKEYADHHVDPSTRHADAKTKKHSRLALHDHGAAKHPKTAKASKVRSG
jgi:hypothetical protein